MKTESLQGFQLSPQQKYLWRLQQDSNLYLSQAVIEIEGKVNLKVLQAAVQKIIDRQEILRTKFYRRSGISIPFQVIAESHKVLWQIINFKNLNKRGIEFKLLELLQLEKFAIFNLDRNSLLRLLLITLNSDRYYFVITLPSLCADSQTIDNLVKELSQSYSLCLQGKDFLEEPVQYIQFSEWQNELLTEAPISGRNYWQQQQLKERGSLTLPGELDDNETQKTTLNTHSCQIKNELVDQVYSIVGKYNTNLSKFLKSCWYILIWKLTNRTEIAIANLFTGRKYEELENSFGLLAQFLPVSCTISKQFTFQEILSSLESNLHQVEQYQEYYLRENSDLVGANGHSPLHIGFEFEQLPDKYDANGVYFSLYKKDIKLENFKIKLTCYQRQDSLITEFHYDSNKFSSETINRLARQFHTLIKSVVNNPEATVGELTILDRQHLHQLLVEFNDNITNYPQDKCIHQLFKVQVNKTPNNVAVVFGSEQLTYSELNRKADILASYLKQRVKQNSLVGLYLDRSLNTVIGLLGILKAGAAYLPLDSALPTEGLTFRLQDASVSVLLTQRSLLSKISTSTEHLICLDTDWETIEAENQVSPHNKVQPDNLVYAIYTSGSTGTPKAVAIAHKQLVNYVYSIVERFNISPGASFATVSTFAADLGNTMLFPALCTGGCLHIISQETASDPQEFNNYCQRHPIDYLKIVPSHLSALLSSSPEGGFLPRKQLILGGEASNWELIAKIQQQKPNCQIFNHYGPTETTVGVLTYQIESETNNRSTTVPIGKPLANTQVYLLDEQLQPVPIGVPGELYIGGVQVSRGYLNQPELTKEKFISIPSQSPLSKGSEKDRLYKTGDKARYLPDGNIEFLGRIDRQVKIRGFRIELGEIESKLQQHPGIQSAVVIANEESLNDRRLIAYVVINHRFRLLDQNQDATIASELRSFCVDRFPESMIPSAFVVLKALPLTVNGKIDYQALPTPEQTRPDLEQLYIAPRSHLEKQLAEIWAEVLGLERIGIHDNFFELGGHSLLITQLLAKVRNTFSVELPLKDLFNNPTIADLAESINDIFKIDRETEIKTDKQTNINLHSEVILDPEITSGNNSLNIATTPNSILLTGATGFLGAFLLNELLQQTSADIYCLIRAENNTLAQERIENKLKSYLLWDPSFSKRIIPVVGDLSQPLLGLSADRFVEIAESVDVIYHNGAWVNFTYPYAQLKAANVLGTQEVLRLAVQSKVKPVHFISTIGVVSAADRHLEIVSEDTPIDRSEQIESGYTQSKWVAEKLVTIARDRGIPISIYRPGRISGHSQTGVCNPNDHTFRMIRGCIKLGSVPQDDSLVNLTPVDYAVGAIIHLSSQPESLGKTFHLFNPQPTPWDEVVKSINTLGYSLQQIDYQQWRKQLLTTVERSPDNPLSPLISTFIANETANSNTESAINQKLEASNTNSGLAETSIICPPCDRQLLSTYVSYLIKNGFLAKPAATNTELN